MFVGEGVTPLRCGGPGAEQVPRAAGCPALGAPGSSLRVLPGAESLMVLSALNSQSGPNFRFANWALCF